MAIPFHPDLKSTFSLLNFLVRWFSPWNLNGHLATFAKLGLLYLTRKKCVVISSTMVRIGLANRKSRIHVGIQHYVPEIIRPWT